MLASLKRRRPLLHVRSQTFFGIVAGEKALLQFSFHGQG
jgi:hypothetical protein